MYTAKVIGATGYGGIGIIELLLRHPEVKLQTLVAKESAGTTLSSLYPHLLGFCDMPVVDPDSEAAQESADIVFFSTPDRVGMYGARAELERGAKVIDYSGDFRANTVEDYAEYARRIGKDPVHASPDLLPESVYGAAELHRADLTPARRLVGNPGCFAISCILGLAPAAAAKAFRANSVICDCKSGISGAGKKTAAAHHYPNRYDMMNAYRLSGHQHVCEIERELGKLAGTPVTVTFTAQVVPVCRGIMSCLYADLLEPKTEEQMLEIYRDFYKDSPFIRVFPSTASVGSMHVRGTNYANLVVSVDSRTNRLRVVSYIDNLMKGQAGSACQAMNLILGLPETMALDHPGFYP